MAITETFGHLRIVSDTDSEGIYLTVFSGTERISELCANFPWSQRQAAVAHYSLIRAIAREGHWADQVVAQFQVIKSAAEATIPDSTEGVQTLHFWLSWRYGTDHTPCGLMLRESVEVTTDGAKVTCPDCIKEMRNR